MPVRRVGRDCFQWGRHGKVYCGHGARAKAERQGRAAYAHGYRGMRETDDHDLIDALDHMSQQAERDLDLGDFDVTEKTIRVSRLNQYDDLFSWAQWSTGDLADMDERDRHDELVSFRGSSWARRAEQWTSSTVPPIIIVELLDGNMAIADGRGRTSYAIGMGWKTIPVVFLTERD